MRTYLTETFISSKCPKCKQDTFEPVGLDAVFAVELFGLSDGNTNYACRNEACKFVQYGMPFRTGDREAMEKIYLAQKRRAENEYREAYEQSLKDFTIKFNGKSVETVKICGEKTADTASGIYGWYEKIIGGRADCHDVRRRIVLNRIKKGWEGNWRIPFHDHVSAVILPVNMEQIEVATMDGLVSIVYLGDKKIGESYPMMHIRKIDFVEANRA